MDRPCPPALARIAARHAGVHAGGAPDCIRERGAARRASLNVATDSVLILCDSREARSGLATHLAAMPGITVTRTELACGDYVVEDRLVIERKSAADFVLSVMDGRLFEQAGRMAAQAAPAVLLLEGDPFSETRSSIEPASIAGALSALPVFFGVSLLRSSSVEMSALLIATMARHVTQGLGYEIPLRAAKPKGAGVAAQFLAEGLPGVGPATARKLLQHFGTPRALFAATPAQLREVAGIGPKLAEGIAQALDTAHGPGISTKRRPG